MRIDEWRPWSDPPNNSRLIILRFDEDGRRDCKGRYIKQLGGYFKSDRRGENAVHPKWWREAKGRE